MKSIIFIAALLFTASVNANPTLCHELIDGSTDRKDMEFAWLAAFHDSYIEATGYTPKLTGIEFAYKTWFYCEVYPDKNLTDAAHQMFEVYYK